MLIGKTVIVKLQGVDTLKSVMVLDKIRTRTSSSNILETVVDAYLCCDTNDPTNTKQSDLRMYIVLPKDMLSISNNEKL